MDIELLANRERITKKGVEMEDLVGPAIMVAVLGSIALVLGGIFMGAGAEGSDDGAIGGGVIFTAFGLLLLAISMTIFALGIDPPNGGCKVGINPGTYEARVVNEVDGIARLLIEKGDEGSGGDDVKAAENADCRLVPVQAFRPDVPAFSTDPYTIEVTDSHGFTSITVTR